jgi:hypothetical protein
VRVFATPDQRRPITRGVSLGVRAPVGVPARAFSVSSNLERWRDVATNGPTLFRTVSVCVPPGGFADFELRAEGFSPIYGDMKDQTALTQYREGGVLLVQIALADERGAPCRPRESR